MEVRGKQSQPHPRPPPLSEAEELQVLRPAGPPEPGAPGGSDAGWSGPSLGQCAVRCAPECWRWRTLPVRGQVTTPVVLLLTSHTTLSVSVATDPQLVQLLVGLHQLFLQLDNLQHGFVLHVQQSLRHLRTGETRCLSHTPVIVQQMLQPQTRPVSPCSSSPPAPPPAPEQPSWSQRPPAASPRRTRCPGTPGSAPAAGRSLCASASEGHRQSRVMMEE